jgi:hypothetical protein
MRRALATAARDHSCKGAERDTGIDRDAIRHALDALIRERDRLHELQRACPPSRAYEISTLTTRRDDITEQLADVRHDLETIENPRRVAPARVESSSLTRPATSRVGSPVSTTRSDGHASSTDTMTSTWPNTATTSATTCQVSLPRARIIIGPDSVPRSVPRLGSR